MLETLRCFITKTFLLSLTILLSFSALASSSCNVKARIKIERSENRQYLWCLGEAGDPFSEEFLTSRNFKFHSLTRDECDQAAQELIGQEVTVKFLEGPLLGMVILYHEPHFYECSGKVESIRKIKYKLKRSSTKG
jgi:hypothetical protein